VTHPWLVKGCTWDLSSSWLWLVPPGVPITTYKPSPNDNYLVHTLPLSIIIQPMNKEFDGTIFPYFHIYSGFIYYVMIYFNAMEMLHKFCVPHCQFISSLLPTSSVQDFNVLTPEPYTMCLILFPNIQRMKRQRIKQRASDPPCKLVVIVKVDRIWLDLQEWS
jgi:hypothetical protein